MAVHQSSRSQIFDTRRDSYDRCAAEAEIHFKRALALNPNDADVAAVFANILVYWGRWREALTWIDRAERLNPLPPNLYHWYHALALYSGHDYEQAVKVLKQMRIASWPPVTPKPANLMRHARNWRYSSVNASTN